MKQDYNKYNWHSYKNTDCLVKWFASNMVILNEAHRVAWLIVQNHRCEVLTAICTCERSTGTNHSLRQAHCERRSTIISLKKGALEEIIAKR